MEAYYVRNFKEAKEALEEVLGILTTEQNSINDIRKSDDLLKNPLPEDWDGVERFVSK